jgi:hypothetical protein
MSQRLIRIATVILVLGTIACASLAMSSDWNITLNGEPVEGLERWGMGIGGMFVAMIAAACALVFAFIAVAGASMLVLCIFAFVGLLLLMVFSPILMPFALLILIVALIRRKSNSPK